jgi:hypothetical protein
VREIHGGERDLQENLGFFGGHPDGFANEEWFGVVAIDRRKRMAYQYYREDYAEVVAPPDLDGDAIPDVWEYAVIDSAGASPVASIFDLKASGDLDGDGMINIQEFRAGTDPLDPASLLILREVSLTPEGHVHVRWSGDPGARHVVERALQPDASGDGAWEPVFSGGPPSPAEGEFVDRELPAVTRFFYRLRMEQ